jgi:hypothetical protein
VQIKDRSAEEMFSHVMVGADDVAASKQFYDATLGALGIPAGRLDYLAYLRDPAGNKVCSLHRLPAEATNPA